MMFVLYHVCCRRSTHSVNKEFFIDEETPYCWLWGSLMQSSPAVCSETDLLCSVQWLDPSTPRCPCFAAWTSPASSPHMTSFMCFLPSCWSCLRTDCSLFGLWTQPHTTIAARTATEPRNSGIFGISCRLDWFWTPLPILLACSWIQGDSLPPWSSSFSGKNATP
jgi:hypothetical protein